jgi:hypothetical protein
MKPALRGVAFGVAILALCSCGTKSSPATHTPPSHQAEFATARAYIKAAKENDRKTIVQLTEAETRVGALQIAAELRHLLVDWHLGHLREKSVGNLLIFKWTGRHHASTGEFRSHLTLSLGVRQRADRSKIRIWEIYLIPTERPIN